MRVLSPLLAPSRPSALQPELATLLGRERRHASRATLEPAATPERHGGGVFAAVLLGQLDGAVDD
jgi:hypothetical protein